MSVELRQISLEYQSCSRIQPQKTVVRALPGRAGYSFEGGSASNPDRFRAGWPFKNKINAGINTRNDPCVALHTLPVNLRLASRRLFGFTRTYVQGYGGGAPNMGAQREAGDVLRGARPRFRQERGGGRPARGQTDWSPLAGRPPDRGAHVLHRTVPTNAAGFGRPSSGHNSQFCHQCRVVRRSDAATTPGAGQDRQQQLHVSGSARDRGGLLGSARLEGVSRPTGVFCSRGTQLAGEQECRAAPSTSRRTLPLPTCPLP